MDRRFFLSLIAGLMAACASKNKIDVDPVDDGQEGGTPVDEGTTLNGTRIEEGNNLYGVITDTEGNPVRNVPVTDGFRFAVTDTNGVYQMKADPKSTAAGNPAGDRRCHVLIAVPTTLTPAHQILRSYGVLSGSDAAT